MAIGAQRSVNSLTRCKPLLGTYVEVTLQAQISDASLLEQSNLAFSELQRIHDLMSFHQSDSELSHINKRAFQQTITVSDDMLSLFASIDFLYCFSDGKIDPTIAGALIEQGNFHSHSHMPMMTDISWRDVQIDNNKLRFLKPLAIDLGGIAKGYAVDRVFEVLDNDLSIAVNAGGDLRFSDWQSQTVSIMASTGAKHQLIDSPMLAPALATSAAYYNDNNSVIVDPLSQQLMHRDCAISVFAKTCLMADALTKLVWLQPDCKDRLAQLNAQAFVNGKALDDNKKML